VGAERGLAGTEWLFPPQLIAFDTWHCRVLPFAGPPLLTALLYQSSLLQNNLAQTAWPYLQLP